MSTVGHGEQLFLSTKGHEENLLWSTQIMVVDHENYSGIGPILAAGVLFLLHFEQSFPNVKGTQWLVDPSG